MMILLKKNDLLFASSKTSIRFGLSFGWHCHDPRFRIPEQKFNTSWDCSPDTIGDFDRSIGFCLIYRANHRRLATRVFLYNDISILPAADVTRRFGNSESRQSRFSTALFANLTLMIPQTRLDY
jgi:hypothetical protein